MPPTEADVRELVRRILGELLKTPGETTPAPLKSATPPGKAGIAQGTEPLIDEATVRGLAPGSRFAVPAGALVTPLARQLALEQRITLMEGNTLVGESRVPVQQRVAVGADHGGYSLKETLKPHLQSLGYEVVDCGTHSTDPVDYPDIAYAVAKLVADGKCAVGIIIDGAGIGSCMAANKVPGVRAALCYDHATAVNSREHNHANVLTLGAGLTGANLAKQIVSDWLATSYGPGRHAKRVEKIMAIEKRYSRG